MSDVQLPGARASITAETSGFRAAVGQAQGVLLNLEPIVARQWWGLQNLGRAFGAVGSAVAAGFGGAVREAISWESAMTEVRRTTGASKDELADIEVALRKIASTTPIATSELASLAEQAAQLGVDKSNIPEFTRVLGTLIANTELTDASINDVARAMNVLEVPTAAFERFASTLLVVSKNAAATTPEILAVTNRIAAAGHAAGLTAGEVLAVATAVSSLGSGRAEAAGTAVSRTFYNMAAAVGTNGKEIKAFSKIAGESVDQFSTDFRQKPAQAFADFVTGLGRSRDGLVGLQKDLDAVGITSQRQMAALVALGIGTRSVGDTSKDLNAILELQKKAWIENTALVDAAKLRYGTASAQIQLFKNEVSAAANQVGVAFLPALKIIVSVLQDFVFGFTQLNGPLKFFIVSIAGVIGAISLLGASVVALVGPLVLALHTLRSLSGVFNKTAEDSVVAAEAERVVAVANEQVAATAVVAAEQLTLLDEALGLVAFEAGPASAQLSLFTVAETEAAVGAEVLGDEAVVTSSKLAILAKTGALLVGGLAIGAIALTIFGHKAREAANATQEAVKPNLQLVDAIDQQARGINNAADEWLLQQAVMSGTINIAKTLKITMADLFSVIQGTASPAFAKGLVKDLTEADSKGKKGAKELLQWTADMNATWRQSALASGHLKEARKGLAGQNEDTANSEADLGAATDKAREKQEKANQATQDLVSAILAQGSADLAVKDAQREYTKAVEDAANVAEFTANAEAKLTEERLNAEKASRDLQTAESNLANARQQAADDLIEKEGNLADARDKYADSLDKIKDSEDKLAKLREGPSLKELTDATNKLADAQNNLRHAEQGVKDAEWQIAFLRGEGASNRALQDAESALTDARVNLADQTTNVSDAEDSLDKLRSGASADDITKAERDLDAARRDSATDLKNIAKQEKEVADQRDAIANDTAYKDAQIDVAKAHEAVFSATENVRKAEQDLADIRNGSLNDAVRKAELNLTGALVDQAKAAVAVQRETAIMRGEFWDAGREAQALAVEIGKVLNQAPTSESRKQLEDFIGLLRQAKPQGEPSDGSGSSGTSGGGGIPPSNDLTGVFPKPKDNPTNDKSWWEKFMSPGVLIGSLVFAQLLKNKFTRGLIAKGLTKVAEALGAELIVAEGEGVGIAAAGMAIIAETWPFLLGAAIIAALYLFFTKTDIGRKIWHGLVKALEKAVDFFKDHWKEILLAVFLSPFSLLFTTKTGRKVWQSLIDVLQDTVQWVKDHWKQILLAVLVSPFTLLFTTEDGKKTWQSFLDAVGGVKDWVQDHWKELLLGVIVFAFAGLPGLLAIAGGDMIKGLWKGIKEKFKDLMGDFGKWLYDHIVKPVKEFFGISSPSKVFTDIGSDMIQGLWNGMQNAWNGLWGWVTRLPETIIGVFRDTGGWLINQGANLLNGLWNGMQTVFGEVANWFGELPGRFVGAAGDIRNTLFDAGRQIIHGLWDGLKDTFEHFFKGAWNGLLDKIPGGLADRFKIRSPSLVFRDFGVNIMQGLILGLKQQERLLSEQINSMGDTVEKFSPKINPDIALQFNDKMLKELAVRAGANAAPTVVTSSVAKSAAVARQGDTFNITGADERSAIDISEEVMFKKLVRTGG